MSRSCVANAYGTVIDEVRIITISIEQVHYRHLHTQCSFTLVIGSSSLMVPLMLYLHCFKATLYFQYVGHAMCSYVFIVDYSHAHSHKNNMNLSDYLR